MTIQETDLNKVGNIEMVQFNWFRTVAHGNGLEGKGVTDERSMKHRPPAIQGGEDHMVNRVYLAAQEMKKLRNYSMRIER